MKKLSLFLLLLCTVIGVQMDAQEVEIFQQFNGRYDYVAFGNTLNIFENTNPGGPDPPCDILTSSSAPFALEVGQTVVSASLYWAGSGTGDFQVLLNGTQITAERTFADSLSDELVYFAAYADVTNVLTSTGNGVYTVSDLDLTDVIAAYCGNTTNFGGWAINVIYEDASLPLNQVSIFDGLENVSAINNNLSIQLENINVLDINGAKIGFLSWEGDMSLDNNETLLINGNIISNPPLNPADNAFNGTNSFTGSAVLYNMDIDFYNIENNINPGDTSVQINLTSNQDFVMINNVITVLNSQLPDATIVLDNVVAAAACGAREVTIQYTVFNVNCTDALPENTPIAFYANNTLVGQSQTNNAIAIGGNEGGTIGLTIPNAVSSPFEIRAVVDDLGNGTGIVTEIIEDNNEAIAIDITLLEFPNLNPLVDLEACDAVGIENFDLNEALINLDLDLSVSLHLSEADATANIDPITDVSSFENTENPQEIFVRADNGDCQLVDDFMVAVVICPLPDATVTIDNNLNACRRRDLSIQYTVFNTLGTLDLPAKTPIAFYISGQFSAQAFTQEIIPIGGSESSTLEIVLSESVADTFTLIVIVDDLGTQMGIVEELDETNNEFTTTVIFEDIPPIQELPNLTECDEGFNRAIFDLTLQDDLISTSPGDTITYYTSALNAFEEFDPIEDPENFTNTIDPQAIFVRLENEICFTTTTFILTTENCPPYIPQGFSPNGDTLNDEFEISRLLNVFGNFELQIFSREGNLIYAGGNDLGFWNGIPNNGYLYADKIVPVGTYYYVLLLNDPNFPDAFTGFVYINY
jgi:gliding motility-associated-like protein